MPGTMSRLVDRLHAALRRRSRLVVILAAVMVAHLGLYDMIASGVPPRRGVASLPAVIVIELLDPPAPLRSPPDAPAPDPNPGGAPASASRARPAPSPVRPEVFAPPEPAPEPELTVGLSAESSPTPGPGRGVGPGQGTGSGQGDGEGAGQPPRLLTGPTLRQVRALHPRAALAARRAGRGVIACRIRPDTRLEGCRVVSETPADQGFGMAALQAAPYFRFRPPTGPDGTVRTGHEVTFGLDFGPPAEDP